MGRPASSDDRHHLWFDLLFALCISVFFSNVFSPITIFPLFDAALTEELNCVKAAAVQVTDKVNAHGETTEARLADAGDRIDEVALQGVHLGAALGLTALSSQTGEDYAATGVGFGNFADAAHVDRLMAGYEDHAAAVAAVATAEMVLDKLHE